MSNDTNHAESTSEQADSNALTRARLLRIAAGTAFAGAVGLSGVPGAGAAVRRRAAPTASSVTVSLWGDHPEWKQGYQGIIDRFHQVNSGINVNLTTFPGPDYQAKIQAALVANTIPDLPAMYSAQIPAAFKAHKVINLTKQVSLSHVLSATEGVTTYGNQVLAIPYAAYSLGVFYQKPIFAKYGLKPPQTWAELTDVMTKLKAQGVTPFLIDGKDGSLVAFLYALLIASTFGTADSFSKVSSGKLRLDSPAGIAALQYMADMQPFFQDGFLGTDYNTAKVEFATGKGAMIVGGSADHTGYKLTNPKIQDGVFAWPAKATGGPTVKLTGNELPFCVSSSSSNVKAATTFARFLVGRTAQQYVADHLAQSVRTDISSKIADPVLNQLALAGKYTLEPWYELPALSPVWNEITTEGSGLFTGRYTAEKLAKLLQSKVKVGAHF